MVTIIKDLKIENNSYSTIAESGNDFLNDLSRINVFIGENNCGKSRFMRSLFLNGENPEINFKTTEEAYEKYIPNIENFINELEEYLKKYTEKYSNYIPSIETILTELQGKLSDEFPKKEIIHLLNKLMEILNNYNINQQAGHYEINHSNRSIEWRDVFENTVFKEITDIINKHKLKIEIFKSNEFFNFQKIYIPILRGLRPLSEEDIYQERTIEDYFNIGTIRENGKLTIFTGLESYDLLKSYAHGDFNERKLIEKYQAYLSENFFDGEEVYLIPKEKDKNIISIKIGNEFERPIYELGDGLQSIINITFPLFLNLKEIEETDNVLVFIEEPEIHLHPALQKKLIKTFEDDIFNNFQFFLTTHSNHFLDNTLTNNNVSVFSFRKKITGSGNEEIPNFSIEKFSFDNYSILDELGVKPSSVLMSNCNIFVEGNIDVSYYNHYLKIHLKELEKKDIIEEGYNYNFTICGGSEMKHVANKLNEREKSRSLFIIDRDDNDNSLEEVLKENECEYHILQSREVENLLKKDVLINALKDFDQIKNNNIQINENFSEKDYQDNEFYEFIKEDILNNAPEFVYKKKNVKKYLLRKSLPLINTKEDLSKEAQSINELIYNFISKNND